MGQYNKLWVALAGAIVAILNLAYGEAVAGKAQEVIAAATPLVTALFVYFVPNKV